MVCVLKKRWNFNKYWKIHLRSFQGLFDARGLRCSSFFPAIGTDGAADRYATVDRQVRFPYGILSESFKHVVFRNIFILISERRVSGSR